MNLDLIYTELIAEHSQYLDICIEEGKVAKMRFHGVGCAISQASTSMMIELLEGKPIDEALALAEIFIKMIKKEITSEEELAILGDAMTFQSISIMPARVKCAVLSWYTLKEAIENL